MKRFGLILVMAVSLGLAACDKPPESKNRGVYMLMDTSGTYTNELRKAQQIINAMLTRLDPSYNFV